MASDDLSLASLEDGLTSDTKRLSASASHSNETDEESLSDSWEAISATSIEAQKIANNRRFGFKKWKSRVTRRPLESRSALVKELYSEPKTVRPARPSVRVTLGNVMYVLLFGWWISLCYLLVAFILCLTIVAIPYAKLCLKLSKYLFWPFGRFVTKDPYNTHSQLLSWQSRKLAVDERTPLFSQRQQGTHHDVVSSGTLSDTDSSTDPLTPIPLSSPKSPSRVWRRPSFWVWLVLAVPFLTVVHSVMFLLSWFLVVFIPVAKINLILIQSVFFADPSKIMVRDQSLDDTKADRQIVLCCYQAVNVYYYKYTVDGLNVILINMLPIVFVAILLGFIDKGDNPIVPDLGKFMLALTAIIPLAYCIGMAVTSIAAQSSFLLGAVLNATFGSVVEIILYLSVMIKGKKSGTADCYPELVKSALTGSLLATMLLIPGVCMIIGGLKHAEQSFNPRTAGVSSTLLFVSVAGAFAPTLFAISYPPSVASNTTCMDCVDVSTHARARFHCFDCFSNGTQPTDSQIQHSTSYMRPLSVVCAVLLPVAYIVGLLFSLKTHKHIQVISEADVKSSKSARHSYSAEWSRVKGFVILLIASVAMSLIAEVLTDNIEPVLKDFGVSESFVGVTLLALAPDIPEIVNGIQFALQNNIALSIEVGSSIAVQVCLLQIPVLVFVDLIHPVGFVLHFNNICLWSVFLSTLLMNYTYMDGKSDYFQGSALCIVYAIAIAMFYFIPSKSGNC